MKLGIVSDIHCNIAGLLLAFDQMGPIDELICAGDAVYQFRFSNEVVSLLQERKALYVLGNHERVLLGEWGEAARSSDGVRPELVEYMAAQPYRIDTEIGGRKLTMVHGSPFEPYDEYLYPNSPNLQKLASIDADFIILGHTHYHMALPVGRALVINPGSAGESRDHRNGFRLSCAVLETDTGEVQFHHYDDPTRPTVDAAAIPQANPSKSGLQAAYTPPDNTAWWD